MIVSSSYAIRRATVFATPFLALRCRLFAIFFWSRFCSPACLLSPLSFRFTMPPLFSPDCHGCHFFFRPAVFFLPPFLHCFQMFCLLRRHARMRCSFVIAAAFSRCFACRGCHAWFCHADEVFPSFRPALIFAVDCRSFPLLIFSSSLAFTSQVYQVAIASSSSLFPSLRRVCFLLYFSQPSRPYLYPY